MGRAFLVRLQGGVKKIQTRIEEWFIDAVEKRVLLHAAPVNARQPPRLMSWIKVWRWGYAFFIDDDLMEIICEECRKNTSATSQYITH